MSHLRSVLSKHIPDTRKPRKSTQPTKPHTPPPQKSCSSPTRTTSSPHTIHHSICPTSTPLHLAHNSQHPQLKNTYPAPQQHPKTKPCTPPQKPLLFTPHDLYLTLLLQHLLHLLLCPNFTPRFRPFYLTSTHKHTTRNLQSNHPKPPTFLSLREIFLRFRTVGFIPPSSPVSR